MATIYLSSTYEDLKDYRRAVCEGLHKSGHQVIAMEDYVAMDERPVDTCLKDVEKADLYVGLFAFRYGHVPPPMHNNPKHLSITELEYRHAKALGRPRLVFLAKEDTGISLKHVDVYTGDGNTGKRIKALRKHLLTEKTVNQFSEPQELNALVLAAVAKYFAEHEQPKSVKRLEAHPPAAITWDIKKEGSPYPGLMHFTGTYAKVFFGRDMEVGEIFDRLRKPEGRFLLISGASGSGKSSLVDAGVLPRIEKNGLAGDRTYTCVRMVPSKGNHPFDALLRPLHSHAERAGMDAYCLAEELVRQPNTLPAVLQEIVTKGLDSDGLVLFLDQMEELFTVRDKVQTQAFLSALYQSVQGGSLHVIAAIRSDFLHCCHEHENLRSVLNGRGYYALGPIDAIGINEVITKPAHCVGIAIAERLVRRLVEEAGRERGNLPLLAFALRQLFNKREGDALTETAFDQLGGLDGAIRSHVMAVEGKIVKLFKEERESFSKLFAPLVAITIDRTPFRRWVSKVKFDVTLRAVIDILIKERLLTADENHEHEGLIAVAHEKLFESWPRLAAWIKENREELFTLRQAEVDVSEWERHGYDSNYLWAEERLRKLQIIISSAGNEHISDAIRRYAIPQDKLIERLQEVSLSHKERHKISQFLAELGDPRPGVGVQDGLPDIVWIRIPDGQVKLQEVDHVFEVKPFHIAKYQVTNAQFEAFIKSDDGYLNEDWWKGIEPSKKPSVSAWYESNAPREMVSWFEAVAFCRWLSAKTGTNIRLPTEWEWQQAARSGDLKREYPWEGEWDGSRCSSMESRLSRTTAVGMYPQGATQQGVMDMAGNVWEWCQNKYKNPERLEAVHINNDKDGQRVIRGGSWLNDSVHLRTSFRLRFSADFHLSIVGFRLAQDIEP